MNCWDVEMDCAWSDGAIIKSYVLTPTQSFLYGMVLTACYMTDAIKIVKVDAETGKVIPLAGAGFWLYRPDGSLITQTFTYPEVTTIDTFYTNSDGYIA